MSNCTMINDTNHNEGATFWLETGTGKDCVVPIGPSGITIGRSETCDVTLDDPAISDEHARIAPREGFCYLQSLDNCTIKLTDNGTQYTTLRDGDVIHLAHSSLIFRSQGGRTNRQDRSEAAQQEKAFQEAAEALEETKNPPVHPIHPLALVAIIFVGLGLWFWAFGLGSIILGFYVLYEIRSGSKYSGKTLAIGVICGGLIVGSFDACQRAGGIDLLISGDQATESCRTNLRILDGALRNYATDHDGQLPEHLEELYPTYISDASMLRCPANSPQQPGNGYFFPASGMVSPPPETILVMDDAPRHHRNTGGFALRANGSVEWLSTSTLKMEILYLKEQRSQ